MQAQQHVSVADNTHMSLKLLIPNKPASDGEKIIFQENQGLCGQGQQDSCQPVQYSLLLGIVLRKAAGCQSWLGMGSPRSLQLLGVHVESTNPPSPKLPADQQAARLVCYACFTMHQLRVLTLQLPAYCYFGFQNASVVRSFFFLKKIIIASVYFMCAFIHLSEDKFQESVAGIELRSPGLVAGYLYLLSHLSSLMLEVLQRHQTSEISCPIGSQLSSCQKENYQSEHTTDGCAVHIQALPPVPQLASLIAPRPWVTSYFSWKGQ